MFWAFTGIPLIPLACWLACLAEVKQSQWPWLLRHCAEVFFSFSLCVCVCRSHRQGRASQAVMWVECRVLEAGCGGRRRSLRSTVMRLPCSFWFLLLLGAGGLLLLHLQDLTETLQQQSQGLSNMWLRLLGMKILPISVLFFFKESVRTVKMFCLVV